MPWIPEPDVSVDKEPFTIALIPDTQFLSETEAWTPHFQAAANWIVDNLEVENIKLVMHLGDVVDNGNNTEFDRALVPMETIWGSGVPFAACIGNHDYDGGAPNNHTDTEQWNAHFGTAQYTARDWWNGEFKDSGKSENLYFTVGLGGRPTLILVVEFFPRAATLTWAEGVIADHPSHDVLIFTHSYLHNDATRTIEGDTGGPDDYTLADYSDGEDMWGAFKQYANVVAVFNGHHIGGDNIADRTDTGDEGNEVFQQFSNFQDEDEGGEGRVVLLTVNPHTGWTTRRVYHPVDEAFETTWDETFRLYQEEGGASDHGALTGLADDDHTQYLNSARHGSADHSDVGHYELVVSGSGPPVAVTNEAADDFVYGFVS